MRIISEDIAARTKGSGDLVDITERLRGVLERSKLRRGEMTVFVVGSTAAITTFEFEAGMVEDMRELYEKLVPSDRPYAHDETWGDANGFSHLRAALQGPSLTIPFEDSRLALGTWQQVVLAEFDTRPRDRKVIVQLMGE
jgi:secondary thiamine-phosphate synthase enzyme